MQQAQIKVLTLARQLQELQKAQQEKVFLVVHQELLHHVVLEVKHE